MENGLIEGFNSRFRQECLNEYWFLSVVDAQQRIEAWRRHYSDERPHKALGNRTPDDFADQAMARHPHGNGTGVTDEVTATPQEGSVLPRAG